MTNYNEPILAVTDSARDHIRQFLTEENAGFSLAVKKTGCSGYAYLADIAQQPRAADIYFTANGIRIFLAADCADILKGTVIDFVDKGNNQKQLVFNNPNANGLCGCGESFTIKSEPSRED